MTGLSVPIAPFSFLSSLLKPLSPDFNTSQDTCVKMHYLREPTGTSSRCLSAHTLPCNDLVRSGVFHCVKCLTQPMMMARFGMYLLLTTSQSIRWHHPARFTAILAPAEEVINSPLHKRQEGRLILLYSTELIRSASIRTS